MIRKKLIKKKIVEKKIIKKKIIKKKIKSKTIRRIIVAVLFVASIGIYAYRYFAFPRIPQVMKEENLTIVEAIEQTEAIEHPDFIKEPYVSILPKGENIALSGKVTASSFAQTYTPMKAADGKTGGVSYWEGEEDSYPNELLISYKEPVTFYALRIAVNPDSLWGKRTQTFSVEVLLEEEQTLEVLPQAQYLFDPDTGNEVILYLEEVKEMEVMGVKLVFTDNTGSSGAQVAEFEIYTTP